MLLTFYVTWLDSTCSVVLGYSWLTHYNPGINWILRHIIFHTTLQEESSSIFIDSPACMTAASASFTLPKLSVFLISAAVFLRASQLERFQSFCIQLSNLSISISACKATLNKRLLDLFIVLSKYYNFTNVFSESQANILAPHYLYNLKIYLDKEISPS